MKRITLLFLSVLLSAISYGQEICNNGIDDDNDGWIDQNDCECEAEPASKRGNIWHFGIEMALDFNSGELEVIDNSAMDSFEGSSAICDENGEILFYSNGGGRLPSAMQNTGNIWNANNEVMYDMMGEEGGGFSATQSSVIVPKPGSTTNYYLFTMEEIEYSVDGNIPDQPQGRGLSYFEVDMSLNGGLGGVVLADERLYVPSFEGVAATQHANGEDYWIFILDGSVSVNSIIVFLATESGVEQFTSLPLPGPTNTIGGWIKVDPAGNRIAVPVSGGSLAFFDFDNANGNIEQLFAIAWPNLFFGDFTGSGKYFYGLASDINNKVFRIDPSTPFNTLEEVGTLENQTGPLLGQVQLAPTGDIYFRVASNLLGKITCPESECPVIDDSFLSLTDDFSIFSLGLTNFPNNFFLRPPYEAIEVLSPNIYSFCEGDEVEIEALTNKCVSYEWSTGETTSSITVSTAGTYIVTLTDDCCPLEHVISVESDGTVSIETNAPDAICEGETIEIEATNFGDNTQINWRDAEGNILAEGTLTATIESDTTFIVEVINDCGSTTDQVSIQAFASPFIELSLNSADCNTASGNANLTNAQNNWSVIWRDDNGAIIGTNNNIDNLTAGTYNIEVIDDLGIISCSSNLDFNITNSDAPEIALVELINNDCPNDENGSIIVNITGGQVPYEITWINDMANIIEFGTAVNNLANGEYQLQVTDANNCETSVFYTIESPIFPSPTVNTQTAFCDNDNGSIQIISGIASDDQILLNGETIAQEDLTALFPGDYQLSIISSSCTIFDSLITITNQIPFEVTGDTTIIITEGDRLPLVIPFSTEGFELSWSPNATLSCNDCPNPIASPTEDIIYTLELFDPITNCLSTLSIQVIVEPPVEIYIPNAFSPNDDGFNDLFTIFPSDPRVVINNFQVYNRWGGLVYESESNDATWDGKANGEPLGSGIFVYFVQIQLPNGEQIIRKGDIALIR